MSITERKASIQKYPSPTEADTPPLSLILLDLASQEKYHLLLLQASIHIKLPSLISPKMPVLFRNRILSEVVMRCQGLKARDKLGLKEDSVEAGLTSEK